VAKRVSFSDERLEPTEIATHQRDVESSLTLYFSAAAPAFASRFDGYAADEVSDELGNRLNESDLISSLTVLAAVEAAFRIDYLQRCYKKKKDRLSRALRTIYQEKRQHASLEDDIFEAWVVNASGTGSIIGELRGAFKFRHWLAHGRYWKPKLGRRYNFDDVYVLADQTLNSFPFDGGQ
jgi:hypothetical protein